MRVHFPKDLRQADARTAAIGTLAEVERRFPNGIPLLDPEEDMSITDPALLKALRRAESTTSLLQKHPLATSPDLVQRLLQLQEKQVCPLPPSHAPTNHAAVCQLLSPVWQALGEQARLASKEVKAAGSLIMRDELKGRQRVLRRLSYVDRDGLITVKGVD